jgi:hypothetical protein
VTGPVLAVTHYQVALLLRSQRWVPPLLLLGFVLVTATAGGPPAGDALAFGAAALVPVSAWLTRLVLTGEPAAARACLMAATGAARTQLGCLLAALLLSGGLCLLTTAAVTALVAAGDGAGGPGVLAATAASGLVSALACTVVGVALGAVCNPPVLRRADAAVLGTGTGVIIALAAGSSPAYAALDGLSRTARTAAAPVRWTPLLVATALLLAAGAGSVRTAVRRGVH